VFCGGGGPLGGGAPGGGGLLTGGSPLVNGGGLVEKDDSATPSGCSGGGPGGGDGGGGGLSFGTGGLLGACGGGGSCGMDEGRGGGGSMGRSAIEKQTLCLGLGRSESCANSISSPSDAPARPTLSQSRGSVPSSSFFFKTRSRNDVAWLAIDLPASSSSSSSQKKPSPPSSSKKVDPNVAASFFSESVGLRGKGLPLPIRLPRGAPLGESSES